MKYKIIAACPAGLGNRIKCIISTIKSCDETGAKPYVYWPLNDACGCKFEELFESSMPIKEIGRSELDGIKVAVYNKDAEINKSWKFKYNHVAEMDFQYHKLPRDWIVDFLPYVCEICPKEDIEDTAKAFVNKHKKSFSRAEVIGVHIRKGDYKVSFDGRQNISKEEDFIERMRCLLEVNPDYKFLLCTEDKETEERFRLRFGSNRIIYFPKRFRDRNDTNGVKEAFVDMLLLARCPIIIGTFLSTFTELAWWGGQCKSQVIIPGTEDKKAVAKVLSKLPQEGEWIHKKIIRKIKMILRESKIKLMGERVGICS